MATPASSPLGAPSSVLGVVHPLHRTWRETWSKLLDVYEGAGGFLDPARPYLIAHPREWLDHSVPRKDGEQVIGFEPNPSPSIPSPKLIERRKLARYENIAATLVEQLAGALFREAPARSFADTAPAAADGRMRPIEQFWADADGEGTAWDDLLDEAWKPAAALGHVWLYADVSEDTGLPVIRAYTPLDVPDWLTDAHGRIVSIKFLEAAPRESYTRQAGLGPRQTRVRVVDAETWQVQDTKGNVLDEGEHPFGVVPATILYAKRRTLTPMVGRSVLGDPALHIDLYNLISETRELLRKTAFAVINVPVGDTSGGVQAAQSMIGQQSGTGNLLFTPEPAQILESGGTSVEAYHAHIDRLVRLIYRLSVVAWESDSRDAESAESRKIKRDDLDQVLAGYADECRRVDLWAARMVYRATYGDAWERWWAQDGLTLAWPKTFSVTPMSEIVQQFVEAIALDLGETATKALKKAAANVVLPDASRPLMATVHGEIDAMTVATEEERRQQELDAMTARLAGAA